MSDVKYFKCACPHCAGHIEFPQALAGQMIDCPHCSQKMKLAAPTAAPEPPPVPSREKQFKACPHCGAVMDEKAIACPQCGTDPAGAPDDSMKEKGKALPIAITLMVLGLGAGGFFLFQKNKNADSSPVAAAPPATNAVITRKQPETNAIPVKAPKSLADLKADAVTLDKAKDGNLVYATGTLRNDSEYQRFGVKIEIELLDAAEKKVGTATDYIQVMEPRTDWHFRALVNDSKTVKGRVASIKED